MVAKIDHYPHHISLSDTNADEEYKRYLMDSHGSLY